MFRIQFLMFMLTLGSCIPLSAQGPPEDPGDGPTENAIATGGTIESLVMSFSSTNPGYEVTAEAAYSARVSDLEMWPYSFNYGLVIRSPLGATIAGIGVREEENGPFSGATFLLEPGDTCAWSVDLETNELTTGEYHGQADLRWAAQDFEEEQWQSATPVTEPLLVE